MSTLDHRARRGWGLRERQGRGWEGIRDAVSPENHSGHTSLTHRREDAAEERTRCARSLLVLIRIGIGFMKESG